MLKNIADKHTMLGEKMKKTFIILSILGLGLILGYACSKKGSSSNPVAPTTPNNPTTYQITYKISTAFITGGSYLTNLTPGSVGSIYSNTKLFLGDAIAYFVNSTTNLISSVNYSANYPWSVIVTMNPGQVPLLVWVIGTNAVSTPNGMTQVANTKVTLTILQNGTQVSSLTVNAFSAYSNQNYGTHAAALIKGAILP